MEKENSTTRMKIVDYNELVCHQQLYKGKPLHKVMDIIKVGATLNWSIIKEILHVRKK